VRNLTVLILAAACTAFAADSSNTQRIEFPAGGTLRLLNSTGELTIESWDQADIELTSIVSAKTPEQLARVRIAAERKGDQLVVTTVLPRARGTHLEYRIKAPPSARLDIEHKTGEIHVIGMSGDMHVRGRMGQITVELPEEGHYGIDAKAKLGGIESDFAGDQAKKHRLGHTLLYDGPSPSQKLYLRIGFGDVTILKMRKPSPTQR